MNPAEVPPEFRGRVSDDGRQARLAGMQLASVPGSLGNLTALTWLDLGGNGLASVPEWLGNLTALTALFLQGNQLTALPLRLADLLDSGLELGLEGNPLADPLLGIAEQGAAELAAYLRSLHGA
jgi:internalin A